jgi:hypothetical protein
MESQPSPGWPAQFFPGQPSAVRLYTISAAPTAASLGSAAAAAPPDGGCTSAIKPIIFMLVIVEGAA